MAARGGRLLTITVDPPETTARLLVDQELPFTILSDLDASVIRAYGLAHEGGGLDGETIAVPAQLLVRPDGSIAWRHVARFITDRVDPRATRAAIERLRVRAREPGAGR